MSLLLSAFFVGLLFNAVPGPVFAATVRAGARGGFRPALLVQIGSLVGDAAWAIGGLAGVGVLLQWDAMRVPVGVLGSSYLLYLAWDSWQAAKKPIGEAESSVDERSELRVGILLSLTNPQNLAYWAALGSAMTLIGLSEPSLTQMLVFFLGFMLASLIWSLLCAFIVDRIFVRLAPSWSAMTCRACAVAFLLLALLEMRALVSVCIRKAVSFEPIEQTIPVDAGR